MGKKAGGKGKKGGKKGKKGHVGPDTNLFLDNYRYACHVLGHPSDKSFEQDTILKQAEGIQLSKITFGEHDLNPIGVRCIVEGLLGTMLPIGLGPDDGGMNGQTYLNVDEIQIWKSNVGDDGAASIGKLLKSVQDKSFRLTLLDLLDNNIGERGCAFLGHGLAEGGNTTLKKLSLDHNPGIGDAGCRGLCEGLRTNSSLEALGLEFCGIGPDGARRIAQVIYTPTCKLKTIRLMGNKILRQGFVNLAMGLKKNETVQVLDVGDNEIGEYPPTDTDRLALEQVIEMLVDNKTLTALNLDLNFIGSSGYNLLDAECRRRLPNVLTRALVIAAGMAPETVEGASAPSGGGKKPKGKGKGKKKK